MARQLDAVDEHGVLRSLTPLHLAECQHIRITLEETNGPLSWASPEPVNPCRTEMEWLAKESREYAGQWVALDGSRLVAHGPKLALVRAAADLGLDPAAASRKRFRSADSAFATLSHK